MFKIDYTRETARRQASDNDLIHSINKKVNDSIQAAVEEGLPCCDINIGDVPQYIFCALVAELKQLGFKVVDLGQHPIGNIFIRIIWETEKTEKIDRWLKTVH